MITVVKIQMKELNTVDEDELWLEVINKALTWTEGDPDLETKLKKQFSITRK